MFCILRGLLVKQADGKRLVQALSTEPYLGNDYIPRVPDDHYVFAGEVPWSNHFACGVYAEAEDEPYEGEVGRYGDTNTIQVETLAHGYAWESYHSTLNQAGGNVVPSASFSRHFHLRRIPPSFDQDGHRASITASTPSTFGRGHILFVREDLLVEYARSQGKELVWAAWGERNVSRDDFHPMPKTLGPIYQQYQHIWRRILNHSEMCDDIL